MSSSEYNTNAAPDVLQLNMETISKELNDLIVTAEQEFGITQQHSSTPQSVSTPAFENRFQVPTYITNAFYGQHRHYGTNMLQNMKHNLGYYPAYQQPVPVGCATNTINNIPPNQNLLTSTNYLAAGNYLNHSALRSYHLYSNAAGIPSYEFHYLRSNGDNTFFASVPPSNGQGAFRKMTKLTQKHIRQNIQTENAANEEKNFDLSTVEFCNDNDSSTVRHIFDLLRDLHRAVAQTPPSFELNSDSQFEETFAPSVNKKSTMPSTLNVQNQVKQACRRVSVFTYEMQNILQANKMFEPEMLAECEFYLNQLRQCLNQLEPFKRIVMEHKHGKFVRDEVKVHAERLSLLLENINRQIREIYIRILAVDWYIGVKHRGDVELTALQLNNPDKNEQVSKKSEIGVINEILQMCNTTPITTSIKTNTLPTTTATTTAMEILKVQTKTTKPETTTDSTTNFLNYQDVTDIKSLINKHVDIHNIYKPDYTETMATVANNTSGGIYTGHTRNPVFYIG